MKHFALALGLLLFANAPLQAEAPKADRYYEDALSRFERDDAKGAVIQLKNALQLDASLLHAHVLMGRAYLKQGDPAAAEAALAKAAKLGADRSEIAVYQAQAYFDQGKFQDLLERLPDDGLPAGTRQDLLILRGYANMELGDLAGADATLREAARAAPGTAALLVAQGMLNLQQGRIGPARGLAEQALALDAREARAWNLQASADHLDGALQSALNGYGKALALMPGLVDARIARVGLLLDLDRRDEAGKELAYLKAKHGLDPRGTYLRSVYLTRRGDANGAKAALLETSRLVDMIPPAAIQKRGQLLMLGALAHHGLHAYEKAKGYLEYYLRLHPDHPGARKLLGSIYLAQGSADSAVTTLERAYKYAPGDPKLLTLLAAAYMANNQQAKATSLLEQAGGVVQQSPELSTAMGLSRLAQGQEDTGLAHLSRAYRLRPGEPRLGTALAMLYLHRGQAREAVAIAEAVVKRLAQEPAAYNLLGVAKAAAGDRRGARAAYAKALTLNPGFTSARLNLGKLETLEGHHEEARKQYAQLLKQDPNHVQALYELAHTEEAAGRPREAVRWLEKLLSRDLRHVDAALALAELHLKLGDASKALEVAKQASGQFPDHMGVLSVLGRAHAASGQRDLAKVAFGRMGKQAGFDVNRLVEVAKLQLAIADTEGAAFSLTKALTADANALPAQLLMAEVELRRGTADKAEQRARGLAGAHPRSAAAQRLLGEVLLARARAGEAAQAFQAALALEDSAANALGLYRALAAAGDGARAVYTMADWSRRHPEVAEARLALAEGQLRSGNLAQARAGYEDYLRRFGDQPGVLNNLANILMRQGDAKALVYAERACKLAPGDASANDTLGWLLLQQGQTERALRYLREARLRAPNNPEVRYHLAAALSRSGRGSEARKELEQALRAAGTFEGRAQAEQLLRELSRP